MAGALNADVNLGACLDLAQRLIEIPSPSGEEGEVAELLATYLDGIGATVDVAPTANILATVQGGRPGPRRLFITHTDTASPGRMPDPYKAQLRDGSEFGKSGPVLCGLGAAAPKGALAAMVAALAAVAKRREHLAGTVQLAAVTKDLHADHAGMRELTSALAIDADWALAGEPTGNRLALGARGIAHVRIEIDGTASHWGRPAEGNNPLYGVAELLSKLRDLRLPGHPDLGRATISPFDVRADFTPPLSPDRASLVLDRRILPGEDVQEVVDGLASLAALACQSVGGLQSSAHAERTMYPFESSAEDQLVIKILRLLNEVTGGSETTYITFSSNAGFMFQEFGCPALAFAPGEITDLGPSEHVAVSQIQEAAAVYAALMTML